MALSAKNLKESNGSFYQRGGDTFFSDMYSTPVSWVLRLCNTVGSLLYIVFSTWIALRLKEVCQIYAFVRQAGQENLAETEVLAWARTQAGNSAWDFFSWSIVILGAALLIMQVVTKTFVKKYTVYKWERHILWITFLFTLLQGVLAFWGALRPLASQHQTSPGALIALLLAGIIVVFLLGLSAGKLPYPLEFKQYENLAAFLKLANSLADLIQKLILR